MQFLTVVPTRFAARTGLGISAREWANYILVYGLNRESRFQHTAYIARPVEHVIVTS